MMGDVAGAIIVELAQNKMFVACFFVTGILICVLVRIISRCYSLNLSKLIHAIIALLFLFLLAIVLIAFEQPPDAIGNYLGLITPMLFCFIFFTKRVE